MLAVFGLIQNYVDMAKGIELDVSGIADAVKVGFDTWGFQLTKNDLKKINNIYVQFEESLDTNLGWGTYTAFIIGVISDIIVFIKDKNRREILDNIILELQAIYDIVDESDDEKSFQISENFKELLNDF